MLHAAASSAASPPANVPAFRVCGNYCGPGWCNGGWHSEWDADPNHCGPEYGPPELSAAGEASCEDSCCREHDICCAPGGDGPAGLNATRSCNRRIVECLDGCSGIGGGCHRGFIPVPTDVVWAAMDLVEGWCCGNPCDGAEAGGEAAGAEAPASGGEAAAAAAAAAGAGAEEEELAPQLVGAAVAVV